MANDVIESLEERWPKDSDRLFDSGSPHVSAHVLADPAERFYRMPQGYLRAGDLLVEHALVDLVDGRNILYPALFCYRHAVELYLKQLIEDFGLQQVKRRANHRLLDLWKDFKAILQERGYADSLGVAAVEALIQEMDRADSRSDGFRYPTARDGNPFAFGDRDVDLERLRDSMHAIQNFLECAHMAMRHDEDVVSELALAYG